MSHTSAQRGAPSVPPLPSQTCHNTGKSRSAALLQHSPSCAHSSARESFIPHSTAPGILPNPCHKILTLQMHRKTPLTLMDFCPSSISLNHVQMDLTLKQPQHLTALTINDKCSQLIARWTRQRGLTPK